MAARAETGGALLERDKDLERIRRCLQRAREGHGGMVVLEGPAGMGKTALLAAGRSLAEARGFAVLRSRGAELEREFGFGVVRQLLEPTLARASDQQRAALLSGPPTTAARLLALPGVAAGEEPAGLAAPDPSFAVLHGLYWLCANLAARLPIALVIDDTHWADGASLRFLAFLVHRLEELRAAVIMAARPAEAEESQALLATLTTDPATEVITLRPLTIKAVSRLLSTGLGTEPDPLFAAASVEATGGTPFLVHSLVEALREAGVAPISASAPKVPQVASVTLGRWAGPDSARLARALAILEQAELVQAARLAGLDPLRAASASQLLVRAGVLAETPLSFAHPLVRSAVYKEIPPVERAEAHRRAAWLLAQGGAGPALVAEHLLATTPNDDGWVVDQLRAAANEASARGAPESAAAYLRRALSESAGGEPEPMILLELGVAEFDAGQTDWRSHLIWAVDAAKDDATRMAAALLSAQVLRLEQHVAEAVQVCDRAADRLEERTWKPSGGWRRLPSPADCSTPPRHLRSLPAPELCSPKQPRALRQPTCWRLRHFCPPCATTPRTGWPN
jgi:hypothetical protein